MKKINTNKTANFSPSEWAGKLEGVPCFILGNAPSINDMNLSLLDDYFTLGINRIFYTYDPTMLIWQDLALWVQEKAKVLRSEAIKVCREGSATQGGFYTFKLQGRDARLTSDPSVLYGRGSSGSIAYQFARILGCDPITLVGMDCCNRVSGREMITDFYGTNPMHKPHTLPNCIKGLNFIKNNHKEKTLYNCSFSKVFSERLTIEEVIEKLPVRKYSREELKEIIFKSS